MDNRRAMAVLCWMVFVPLVSSAAIDQAASKKGIFIAIGSADPPKTTVGFQSATDRNNAPPATIECFCNLENCGDRKHCTTGYGCFSELQPVTSGADSEVVQTTTAAPTRSQDFDDEATMFVFSNRTSNGSFGCLDMLSVNKTCDQILKSMEGEDSEFPTLPHQVSQDNVVRAFHCCQENMCNDPSHVATKTVQESLAAVIRNSMSELRGEQSIVSTLAEPLPPADLYMVDNAVDDVETVQAVVVPDNSTTSTKPTTAELPSSVAPSATNSPATDIVATTADLVDNENATPAPVIMDIVDCDSMNNSGDVVVVSHDSTVAVSNSTEHVPSTSTVSTNSSADHSATEVPVAITTVDSSGDVIDTTQSTTITTSTFGSSENITEATQSTTTTTTTTTTVGSSENITEATQSTTTIATATAAAAAAAVDSFAIGNGLTKNVVSETTAPVVIAETSTAEIATTTNGSVEQKTPIAGASDAAHVILTQDKVGTNVNDTATINSDIVPEHNANTRAETSALKSHLHKPSEVDNNNWSFIGLDPTGIYIIICIVFGLLVAMFKAYARRAGVSGTYKGVCIDSEEPCACGGTSAKTAATALYGIGTCAGCVGSSKYAYTVIPAAVRH